MLKRPVVADVMTKDVVTVRPDTGYKDIVETLAERRISGMPVVDETGVMVGVVSEADLLRKEEFAPSYGEPRAILTSRHHKEARAKAAGDTAAVLMSMPPVTVSPYLKVTEAARLLGRNGIKRLPVVDVVKELSNACRAADRVPDSKSPTTWPW